MKYKIAVFFTKFISFLYVLLGLIAVTYPPIAYFACIFLMIAPMQLVALSMNYKNVFLPEFHSIWANELSILLSLVSIVFGILMYLSVGWLKQGKPIGKSIVKFMLAMSVLIVIWNIGGMIYFSVFPTPNSNNSIDFAEVLFVLKDIPLLWFEYWLVKTIINGDINQKYY